MKKFFICLVVLLCIFAPQNCAAMTKESEIVSYVKSLPNTEEVTCVIFGKYCGLGIRTKGILLKSQSVAYVKEVEENVKKIDPSLKKIFVTTDLKETMILKEIKKQLEAGASPFEIYRYVKNKYPSELDKYFFQNYNAVK